MSDQSQLLRMLEPSVRPGGTPAPAAQPKPGVDRGGFADLLQQARQASPSDATRPLDLSTHAQQRLEQRGISLSEAQMQALAQGVDRAEAKGANDALMLMGDVGMIVNVPDRKVVTVLDAQRMAEGVITQIDSAVLVDEPAEDAAGMIGAGGGDAGAEASRERLVQRDALGLLGR